MNIKHALQDIHQSQRNHANNSLINDMPTFCGKPELHFNLILKLENTDMVTK